MVDVVDLLRVAEVGDQCMELGGVDVVGQDPQQDVVTIGAAPGHPLDLGEENNKDDI